MNIKFFHVRPYGKPSNGGTTVAMELDANGCVIAYAESHCHSNDNFCKHIGRAKAGGRLNSPRFRQEFLNPRNVEEFQDTYREEETKRLALFSPQP